MNLKLKQVSDVLGKHPQTVKNWIQNELFENYFSDECKRLHYKRFDERDQAYLKYIAHLKDNDGLLNEQVAEKLASFNPDVDIPTEQTQTAIQTNETTQLMENILHTINSQHEREIAAKDETIRILQDQITELRKPWIKRIMG